MEESWVEVVDYPNYAVSNYGRVLNISRDRLLTPRPDKDGRLRVTLSNNGKVRDFYIHRLVAGAFHTGYDARCQVIHWNDDREDNMVTNLRLLRAPEQTEDDNQNNRQWGKRVEIVETGEVFRTARDCALYIRGDYGSIYACLRGDRNSHRGFTFRYYDEWYGEEAA